MGNSSQDICEPIDGRHHNRTHGFTRPGCDRSCASAMASDASPRAFHHASRACSLQLSPWPSLRQKGLERRCVRFPCPYFSQHASGSTVASWRCVAWVDRPLAQHTWCASTVGMRNQRVGAPQTPKLMISGWISRPVTLRRATVMGSLNRLGPALPGLMYRTPSRVSIEG